MIKYRLPLYERMNLGGTLNWPVSAVSAQKQAPESLLGRFKLKKLLVVDHSFAELNLSLF